MGHCEASGDADPRPPRLPPIATIIGLPPETVPPARALTRSSAHNSLPPSTPPSPRPYTLNEVGTVALPPFSVISSLIFPGVLPEPHVTLSSLGGERFQLSDTALGDLDMMLCVSRVRRSSMELILFYQPVKGCVPARQTRNALHI